MTGGFNNFMNALMQIMCSVIAQTIMLIIKERRDNMRNDSNTRNDS